MHSQLHTDIRAATIIDVTYALILMFFKEMSSIPMSTTRVFLGILAGRELALSLMLNHRTLPESALLAARDASKAVIGLLVSVGLAFGLPALERNLSATSNVAVARGAAGESGPNLNRVSLI